MSNWWFWVIYISIDLILILTLLKLEIGFLSIVVIIQFFMGIILYWFLPSQISSEGNAQYQYFPDKYTIELDENWESLN